MAANGIAREATIESRLDEVRRLQSEIERVVEDHQYDETEIFHIRLAVEEALTNAVKHGNQMDPGKSVLVRYEVDAERFFIRITDEGPGFDPCDIPDPTAIENLERECGRGLFLIRHYMSEVEFEDDGRTIRLVKFRANGTE